VTARVRIAPELELPLDVAGEAIAILAKRGAGKTNTATVLVEEFVAAGVQTVVLDPVGAWWGLRWSTDGKRRGLEIPILGGAHGDVPIEQTAGALIADVAVESGSSLVVDLSDLPSKAAVGRFVTDFAERLYREKRHAKSLLHLVLEEADEFAPQGQRADTARMRGAVEQIVRRGRSRGLGVTLITQRSAVLNKDVLTQADILVVMRTTGPHDRKAIAAWVETRGDEHGRDVLDSLPGLETGEAWVWNPERDLLKRVHVRRRHTFDSSTSPKAGEARREPTATSEIDVQALGEKIAATADKAKENDPAALRRRITVLERELAAKPSGETVEVERVVEKRIEVPIEVPAISDEQIVDLREIATAMRDLSRGLAARADQIEEALRHVRAPAGRERERTPAPRDRGVAAADRAEPGRPAPRPRPQAPTEPTQGDIRISGPQQRILDALAWFESIGVTPRRPPLAAVAGSSSKSSGFEKNVSTLKTAGLIDYPESGRVALTDGGREAAAWPHTAATEEELQDAIYRMVSGPQSTLLRVLVAEYPEGLTREELADHAGVSMLSSGFEKNISTLKSFELITYPARGEVAALPVLFLVEAVR